MNKCRSNDPDTAIAGCTALIQASHSNSTNLYVIYNNRGNAYTRKGYYALAIQDFNEAIRENPGYVNSYRRRGVGYYDERDYDHAIQDFSETIRLSPNSALAYFDRGNTLEAQSIAYDNDGDYGPAIQNHNEAIQDLSEAIRLSPNYAPSYLSRGIAYDRRGIEHDDEGDYDHAIFDYNEAIRLSPNNEGAYRSRGIAYYHKGDYDLAIQDFKEAIRLNPKDTVAYTGRGADYFHQGDYDRAVEDFNEVIRLQPKDTAAYASRGGIYFLQSNLTAAISDFETAISGAPSSRTALSAALILHVAMKRKGRDDSRQLAQVAAAADLSRWPGPLLKLDMGKMTASEVMAASANPGDEKQKWHVCQANYFIGEDALLQGQRTTALAHLNAARDGCPKWGADYVAALAELKELSTPAAPVK